MIQEPLMNILKAAIPHLVWTVDYYTADDNTGTVYSSGGSAPDKYDTNYRHPTYQVYIRSSDWDYAKAAAEIAYRQLHKKRDFKVTVDYEKDGVVLFTKRYYIFLILAASEPLRIGENEENMEYSINFDVTLRELREE